jgi:hypothetical protein
MNIEDIKNMGLAFNQVREAMKKKLDAVGNHDADVDNDGDTDKTDKYLINRRKAIGAAKGKTEEVSNCPHCNGSMENHEDDCESNPDNKGDKDSTGKINPAMSKDGAQSESMQSPDKIKKTLANVKAKPKGEVSLKKAPWEQKEEVSAKTRWPIFARIMEKMSHTAGATAAEKMDAKDSPSAKKMRKDHQPTIPDNVNEPLLDVKTLSDIAKSTKKAPMRSNDNAAGDKAIINPVTDVSKAASKKEDDGFKSKSAPKLN